MFTENFFQQRANTTVVGHSSTRILDWNLGSMVRQVPDPSIFKAYTAQGNRKPLFSVGNGTGEKNKSSNSYVQFNRSDFGSIHKTFIRHRRPNTSRRTLGSSSIVLALLVSMAKGVPHYYLEGYGCTLTAAASGWSHQMHISQPALYLSNPRLEAPQGALRLALDLPQAHARREAAVAAARGIHS